MKKFLRSFLIIAILLFTGCGKVTEQQAIQALSLYLQERYGEEFDIGFGGKRGYTVGDRNVSWYEYEITPQNYKGTNKLYDKYYDCIGTVILEKGIFGEKIETTADTYGYVLLKEQANEFYGKKLKELFGENVLPILEITGSYSVKNKTFLENVELTKKREKENNGTSLYIEGGIYIFGRVENDEDREKYREEIYKFLQFMKETGTFEYVDLDITVVDERVLSYQFQNDKKLKEKIMEMRKNATDYSKFFKERNKLMQQINIDKVTQKERENILFNINRGDFSSKDFPEFSGGNTIFYKKVYSPKYIESQNLDDEEKIEYESLDELQFTWEMY